MARQFRILVVDDDRDHADSLSELFAMEGHSVEVAYSGAAAIEAYMLSDFDITFMDVMMPGKNGLESFLEIKALKPGAKVYMMTGYSVEQLLRLAMDNGALGVFSKPFEIGEVLAAVEGCVPSGIVVVPDDGPDFTDSLKGTLEAAGRSCEVVKNGSAVLERTATIGADTVILDLDRPLIECIEIYSSLRGTAPPPPAIMLANGAAGYEDSYAALNDVEVTGILNKPFDPVMLLGKLDRLVA